MKEVTDIKSLCYNLYVFDWKKEHNITSDDEIAVMKRYLKEYPPECFSKANPPEQTFDEYLEEYGYNGELYVCFDEFLDNEYEDEEYIQYLLSGTNLYPSYLKSFEDDYEK